MHADLSQSIGLVIRRALPAVVFVLATAAVNIGSSGEFTDEKIILGFEEHELGQNDDVSRQEQPGRESWFYLLEQPQGFDFAARFEWPGATNRAWTWHCRRGPHTEGETALMCEMRDPDGLAEIIMRLLDDDALRAKLGAAALEESKKYDINNFVRFCEDLYERLYAERFGEGK